ncbi:response regulator transcription factor [Mucilaginibacter sp. KACC 22063]|uniref:response regulator transcription factor n=1 Tax=Mucilaginibacter sp. KACC 22063 TaxID=3025666 RepID=UPI0023651645|nr:response regulator transcription factor [Mucilaginibacter sp. KACC 22063]WDF54168.1 response regulator transcription factor [Mucilaginibacter sp. KACC 22063]
MYNILLIEDDDRLATVIKRGLEESGYQLTVAYDGNLGERLAFQEKYDVIITDIILPKINGLDLCKHIKQQKPEVPVLMLTALGTTDDKVEGFDAGADDYLVKPFDFRELEVRVRALAKRQQPVSRSEIGGVLLIADLVMNTHTKNVHRNGKEITLTPKEFKLLEYMMRNRDRVLSRSEISEKVWETTFDTGTNFIDVYINYLRKKIDRDYDIKLIHTKPGMGFIFREEK